MTFDEWSKDRGGHNLGADARRYANEIWRAATLAEREECAKVCDEIEGAHGYVAESDDAAQFSEGYQSAGAAECAKVIRDRNAAQTPQP